MRNLNVRLDDDQYDALKGRAEAAGVSVSFFVRDLIGSLGSGEVVPRRGPVEEPVSGSSGASPLPQAPNNRTEPVSESPELSGESPPDFLRLGPQPPFLAAPVDECPLCGHDRQESDHLGGRPCKFKTSPRRNCGCTFEGF